MSYVYMLRPPVLRRATGESVRRRETVATGEAAADTMLYLFPDFFCRPYLERMFRHDTAQFAEVALTGYEVYIVEQWACDRRRNMVVTAYTGNKYHAIRAVQLKVPRDASQRPPAFEQHFDELVGLHLRPKDHPDGRIFVTNISAFPLHLNLVAVPKGDVREVFDLFKVNVNLRRMQCLGRLGLLLSHPLPAAEDKFRQMYRTSGHVNIDVAVCELVGLVQISLHLFGLLDAEFCDGLLCTRTQEALAAWWARIGSARYRTPARQSADELALTARTVAGVIGLLLGLRTRLHMFVGNDVPRDPYTYLEQFGTALAQFQRLYKLAQTGVLDGPTLEKLYAALNQKMQSHPALAGLRFTKAVRSTVQDLGRLKKDPVPMDYETLDLEALVKSLGSRSVLYLWNSRAASERVETYKVFADKTRQQGRAHTPPPSAATSFLNLKRLQDDDEDRRPRHRDRLKNGAKQLLPSLFSDTPAETAAAPATLPLRRTYTIPPLLHASDIDVRSEHDPMCLQVLQRRMSFPFVAVERCETLLKQPAYAPVVHVRLQSFSTVEEAVLENPAPLPIPLAVVARKYLAMLRQFAISPLEAPTQAYTRQARDWEQAAAQAAASFAQMSLESTTRLQSVARMRQQTADLELLLLKLEYEMRVLEKRLAELEASARGFRTQTDAAVAEVGRLKQVYGIVDSGCGRGMWTRWGAMWQTAVASIQAAPHSERVVSLWRSIDPNDRWGQWMGR